MNSIVAELALQSCCNVVQLIHKHRLAAYGLLTGLAAENKRENLCAQRFDDLSSRNTLVLSRFQLLTLWFPIGPSVA